MSLWLKIYLDVAATAGSLFAIGYLLFSDDFSVKNIVRAILAGVVAGVLLPILVVLAALGCDIQYTKPRRR